MANASYDVIVVGAGFGGSACAGLLAKRGLNVLLVEKNSRAGGKAMSLSKNGFTYTAWVVIGAPVVGNLYEAVAKDLGVEGLVDLVAPGTQGSMYKTSSGRYARLPSMPVGQTDPNVIFEWLEIDQRDRDSALAFFAELTMMPPEQIEKLHDVSFDHWLRLHPIPRPLYAFLVSLCCDGMFMVPADLLDAAEAIKSLQDMFLRHGGMFCRGGFGRVAEAYCEAVRRHGGTVIMKAKTDRITVADGAVTGVVTSAGTFTAPIVVSNAGLQPTVLSLVGEEHFGRDYLKSVEHLLPSWALLGHRYFLSKKVTDFPYGVVFSSESPWSLDRLEKAGKGEASREGVVYFEVPSNYDPAAAPEGKQILITGSFCPPSPQMTAEEITAWARAGEEIIFAAIPELPRAIEDKELYTPRDVSNLTRESVLPGHGGETIGLGQVVGQCGPTKPSIQSPIRGLFFVGCDAGGTGVGTQQAIESGMKVADAVVRHHEACEAA
jgi:phytoene dehydrogenase-like protein